LRGTSCTVEVVGYRSVSARENALEGDRVCGDKESERVIRAPTAVTQDLRKLDW